MSAWKLIARELYEAGRPLSFEELRSYTRHDMQNARAYGIVECVGGVGHYRWRLTQRGRDWREGRQTFDRRMPGGFVWRATWLKALPQGLRVAA